MNHLLSSTLEYNFFITQSTTVILEINKTTKSASNERVRLTEEQLG